MLFFSEKIIIHSYDMAWTSGKLIGDHATTFMYVYGDYWLWDDFEINLMNLGWLLVHFVMSWHNGALLEEKKGLLNYS